jgi:hypothetical protein
MMKKGDPDYMIKSRKLLEENACKKIKTTMIGSLRSFEIHLEMFLVDNPELQDAFCRAREDVLNKGNKQINNMKKELDNYEINWKRFSMVLPMRKNKEQ